MNKVLSIAYLAVLIIATVSYFVYDKTILSYGALMFCALIDAVTDVVEEIAEK